MAIGSTVSTTESFPIFTIVEELFVVNGNRVYLYVKLFESEEFNEHYMCYFVTPTTYKLITLECFLSFVPLHMHKLYITPIKFCVVPKMHLCIHVCM